MNELNTDNLFSRREFIKNLAAVSAAMAVGMKIPDKVLASTKLSDLKWSKAICRFCGVGCGILVAIKNDKVVAVKGDPDSPTNRGLLCIKGVSNAQILYGADRLTTPLMRVNEKGEFDKQSDFKPVTWKQAFEEMAKHFKKYYNQFGPAGVAMLGSGQWTIFEGYAAVKFMKAGLRTNNLEPNARLCMASAVVAFIQTFGIDEPAGCYDDIELTDTIVLFGSNMAECHPVLWSRAIDRRLSNPDRVKIVAVSTYRQRTVDFADTAIIIRPQTDLAILNYIAREIVYNHPEAIDKEFLNKYCVFTTGYVDIGYELRDANHQKYSEQEKETNIKQNYKIVSQREASALAYTGLKEGDI
mgnify:FL=1